MNKYKITNSNIKEEFHKNEIRNENNLNIKYKQPEQKSQPCTCLFHMRT